MSLLVVQVSELCTEDGLSDAALLDNSNRNVSGGSQSRYLICYFLCILNLD